MDEETNMTEFDALMKLDGAISHMGIRVEAVRYALENGDKEECCRLAEGLEEIMVYLYRSMHEYEICRKAERENGGAE